MCLDLFRACDSMAQRMMLRCYSRQSGNFSRMYGAPSLLFRQPNCVAVQSTPLDMPLRHDSRGPPEHR